MKLRARRSLAIATALVVAGTTSVPVSGQAAAAESPTRNFDPVAFFTGSTVGVGLFKKLLSPTKRTLVRGSGTVRPDGILVLDQTVAIDGEPTTNRRWLLRQVAEGQFRGSLSDATGPVTAQVTGRILRVHFTMKGGMKVDQVITAAPNGESARNHMKISKFGATVATISETIRRT